METKEIKSIDANVDYKVLNGASEMIDGCNRAIVTYILTEDMKLHKLVTFYDDHIFNFDHIIPGHGYIIRSNYRISLYRDFSYILKDGVFKCSKILRFLAVQLRDIAGFTPDPESTRDYRKQTKRY